MLPGVEALPRVLQPQDLVSRRPPRLNRNMSIAEMGTTKYDPNQHHGKCDHASMGNVVFHWGWER